MIAVEAKKDGIVVSIPTQGMPAEAVSAFVNWLRVEATARRSSMTKEAAWQLAEDVKSDWWSQNQSRIGREGQ
jgi:hypothetical protein